jgi:oxalate decarboxylase/phosphoglucose isomerase-like protein (cupin superfamily)
MYRFRVSVDDVGVTPGAKDDKGFANMDIRFLISDKTCGSQSLSMFRTVFPPGFAAHKKHYHADIEEVLFGIRGRGCVGIEHPDGKAEEFEVSPGVAIFIPKDYVHWFRNLEADKEVEIVGCYNKADAGDYKPEDYIYIGEINEQDQKL